MGQDAVPITVSDWMAAQARTKRYLWVLTLGASGFSVCLYLLVVGVADAIATGAARWALIAGVLVLMTVPVAVGSALATRKQQAKTDGLVGQLTGQLAEAVDIAGQQASRQEMQARRQETRPCARNSRAG